MLDTHGAQFGDGTFVQQFADVQVMAGNSTLASSWSIRCRTWALSRSAWAAEASRVALRRGSRRSLTRPSWSSSRWSRTAPLTAALEAGEPVTIDAARKQFVDGAGSPRVRDEM